MLYFISILSQALEFFCEWKLIDEVKHESSWVSMENLFCYDMAVQFINETLPKATEEIAPLLKKALCYFQLQLSSTYVINDMVINVINQNINTKTNTMYGDFLKSEKNKKCIKRNMRKAKNVLKAENEVELLKAEVQKAVAENLQLNQNKNEISVEIQTLRAEKIKMLSDAQAYEIERGRLITDNERLFADVRQLGTEKKVISDKLADTVREKEKLAEFKPKIINMI